MIRNLNKFFNNYIKQFRELISDYLQYLSCRVQGIEVKRLILDFIQQELNYDRMEL